MAETSEYVDEAIQVIYTLENGHANTLSAFLFENALEALGSGHPQIVGPLKRCLVHPDDTNVRHRVLELVSNVGHGWAEKFGPAFADEVVMSLADSSLLCAAFAARGVYFWEPDGPVTTPLLLWAKQHVEPIFDPTIAEPTQLPSVLKMMQELPTYEKRFAERRALPSSTSSLENNIRLWGKFKGTMVSMFHRE